QGPLEGNTSLFIALLKLRRRISKPGPTEYPPYHVILATAKGQLKFFERYGFKTLEYRIVEVDWPAPSTLTWKGMTPRNVLLFFVRLISKATSSCNPRNWGNRY